MAALHFKFVGAMKQLKKYSCHSVTLSVFSLFGGQTHRWRVWQTDGGSNVQIERGASLPATLSAENKDACSARNILVFHKYKRVKCHICIQQCLVSCVA